MSRTALRCSVEIGVQAVTCPGVWLPRRDDIYLSIRLFNQIRSTSISSPIFPLLFHEKFRFDKLFYTAFEPSQVVDSLQDCSVLIELIQLSDIYEGGRLLASYEASGRDFLYPYPSYSRNYGIQDREVLLHRSIDFPGISPKFEFSTRTVIEDTHVPSVSSYDEDVVLPSGRLSRSRSRSRSRSGKSAGAYKKATISSISRSRSLSPSLRYQFDALDLQDTTRSAEIKPPFVVRKVDKTLIGRKPGGPGRDCAHGLSYRPFSSVGRYSYDDSSLYDYTYRPYSRISQIIREPGTEPYPLYNRYNYFSDVEADDLEVAALTGSGYSTYTRPRTTSPGLYRSSLSDRYSERPWSLAKSDLITTRVERALRRNRSLERLDRLRATSPYTQYSSDYY